MGKSIDDVLMENGLLRRDPAKVFSNGNWYNEPKWTSPNIRLFVCKRSFDHRHTIVALAQHAANLHGGLAEFLKERGFVYGEIVPIAGLCESGGAYCYFEIEGVQKIGKPDQELAATWKKEQEVLRAESNVTIARDMIFESGLTETVDAVESEQLTHGGSEDENESQEVPGPNGMWGRLDRWIRKHSIRRRGS